MGLYKFLITKIVYLVAINVEGLPDTLFFAVIHAIPCAITNRCDYLAKMFAFQDVGLTFKACSFCGAVFHLFNNVSPEFSSRECDLNDEDDSQGECCFCCILVTFQTTVLQ